MSEVPLRTRNYFHFFRVRRTHSWRRSGRVDCGTADDSSWHLYIYVLRMYIYVCAGDGDDVECLTNVYVRHEHVHTYVYVRKASTAGPLTTVLGI